MYLTPIGKIHSPYNEKIKAPFQGRFSEETVDLEIFPQFASGLKDVEKSRYLIILYWGDRADRSVLKTQTPWGPEIRGVFACRTPNRPNPIAFCIGELIGREGMMLRVNGVDAFDGSPLLDIKPYSFRLDGIESRETGWIKPE
ncbi:MAG: tRNA (N6-threonylcarbamoyladenosine(37)-N6)-methyltransferase TrmO [Desulfitobacteriaceae bacterium]|nr:tRNA (N6-threonylcarbamoyladenosine(37)-N6)-methyltransferase TrmO [Desulfitobacteriaceae bacterium]MDD4751907.1 tRNA (N6-threonylcarbamoyladenosine(37)-N6)-methyltransferase TrmO [Desulfitobacteriaceae bacterium]